MSADLAPRAFGHLAISVPDAAAAAAWYHEVLGLQLMLPIADIRTDDPDLLVAQQIKHLYGDGCKHVRLAHMITANGAAIEFFEFVDPPWRRPEENFDWQTGGLFHFALVDPDVPGTAARIEANGGKIRSDILEVVQGTQYQAVYCEDPWGSILEITSHSHPQMLANQEPMPEAHSVA